MNWHANVHLEGFVPKNANVRDLADVIRHRIPEPAKSIEQLAETLGKPLSKEDIKKIRISVTIQEIED